MASPFPFMKFYCKDWLSSSSVADMSLEAQGAYLRLLCYQWEDGHIPHDTDKWARRVGLDASSDKWAAIYAELAHCFDRTNEGYVNSRLADERAKAAEYQKAQAEKGAKGGRTPADAKPGESQTQADAKPGESQNEIRVKPNESLAFAYADADAERENDDARAILENSDGEGKEPDDWVDCFLPSKLHHQLCTDRIRQLWQGHLAMQRDGGRTLYTPNQTRVLAAVIKRQGMTEQQLFDCLDGLVRRGKMIIQPEDIRPVVLAPPGQNGKPTGKMKFGCTDLEEIHARLQG